MDDMDDDDGMGFNEMGGGDYGFDSGDLIAEPSKVAKIQVNFDRVARQLDVKRLKECMWKQLSEEPKEEQEHHTFSQVMADVPKVRVAIWYQSFTCAKLNVAGDSCRNAAKCVSAILLHLFASLGK